MTAAEQPVILAVDADDEARERLSTQLRRRFGADYRIACESSPADALELLRELCRAGTAVPIVLADQWLGGMTGEAFLTEVRALRPTAKRCLLIRWGGWGDRATADAVHRAMELGLIDYYVIKPWRSPDEQFNRIISEFLHEWTRSDPDQPKEIVIVGERWSQRAHALRDLLLRNGMPHSFAPTDSEEGREVLARAGEGRRLPLVSVLGGDELEDPTNAELMQALGCVVELHRAEYDLIIVGAGPAGLAAAVYGSSEGLRTLTVECESVGGQAGSSSLIRNYLGFSRGISGSDLATRAYQQAWVFGAQFLLMREAARLEPFPGGWVLHMDDGSTACAPAIVLAPGVTYRRMGIPELEALTGAGVFYGASTSEAHALQGGHAYVIGGGNSAGQAAMHLSRYAERVNIVVRGATLSTSMSHYLQQVIDATPNVEVLLHTRVVGGGGAGRLERLVLERDGRRTEVEADGLFVMIGAQPRTDWLPDSIARDAWGYVLTGDAVAQDAGASGRWPLERAPLGLESCAPGIFAVGDVRHAAVKRVASAVGEGSVVVSQVHQFLGSTAPAPAPPPASRVGA
jgi:thioredoxin reductase (NADPH)